MSEYTSKAILKTDKYDYVITINTTNQKVNGDDIVYSRYFSIGSYVSDDNEKKTCVDIYVMYPESQKILPFLNYKLAKLITTHYNEKCSVNEKLERGEGTRHMINTAMYLVSRICPFIEGFELNDASTRICDNDTIITLSYFSITQYGKTWYEKNFNAYIEDIQKTNKYKETINKLINLKLTDWNTFNIIFLQGVDNKIKEELESIYKECETYGDFFKNINKKGISNACIYLQPWIDRLMLTTDLRNYILFTQWVIPIKSVKKVELLNYKKGGKRKATRKQSKDYK